VVSPTAHAIEVPDGRIHYVHGGRPRQAGDPPLVLVHALCGATTWWARNLDALSAGAEVYALDLPGFGKSPGTAPFTLMGAIAALQAWLSALGLTRVILLGHSMGGYISVRLALRAPDRIAGLALLAPPIFPPGYPRLRIAQGLVRSNFNLSPDFLPMLWRGIFNAGLRTIWRAAAQIYARPVLPELHALSPPTLLVWGEGDTVVPVAMGTAIKAAMGGRARGPVLLHGGHMAMWDDPSGFNTAVLRFTREICGGLDPSADAGAPGAGG
jgi:pimeloyl-ACP methyl ester carboxylesterase